MKTRQTLLLGLAGLGFVLAWPAQAGLQSSADLAVGGAASGFVLARRDEGEGRYEARREQRDEQRATPSKNQRTRDAERSSVPQDYGYGYERRQQPTPAREDDRHRH